MDDKKFKDYAEAKNFSEPKDLGLDKKCLLCQEPLPRAALAFSNTMAISLSYCSFMCMVGALGDKAYQVLSDKAKQNREDATQAKQLEPRYR